MLTVLIATYNGAGTLPAVLQAYGRLAAPSQGWRLLIIDNGSDDASAAIIASFRERLPLTYLYEGRRGKNAALNRGLAAALGEERDRAGDDGGDGLFVFSDDDAIPAPDWLRQLEAGAAARPDYAVFGGAIVAAWPEPGTPPRWITRLVPQGLTYAITAPELADGPVFPGLVWGANMAVRRAVFEAGYRFDETIGPTAGAYAMGSETQLIRRLFGDGLLSWFCPRARVAHIIRAHQLTWGYVLRRAARFGRGKFRQDDPGDCPVLWRVPRWMLRRCAAELGGAGGALLAGRRDRLFAHCWELCYLAGYFYEAWRRAPLHTTRARILITSYSGALGGMELRMGQEARTLSAAGYASALAVRRFPGSDGWASALQRAGVAVSHFDPPAFLEHWRWRRLNLWRARVFAVRQLRRYRPDLVHVAFCWGMYGASALWLARHCRLPAVISVHNAFPPGEIPRWHRPRLAEAFRAVCGVYAVSPSALRHFIELFGDFIPPAATLRVIPNSVDTQRFYPSGPRRIAARQQWRLPPDSLVLGAVARLAPQKRPEALLRLFCSLHAQCPGLYLVLVGSGPLEPALRRACARAGVAERVIFAGFSDAVETLLPAFDLHLLLSRNEGFGIATIEAMACAVPVVGTDVPGTADILRGSEAGLLVPLDDHDAAVRAVAALLADPSRRRRMGERGRAEVEARYASQQVERQVLAFYRDLPQIRHP